MSKYQVFSLYIIPNYAHCFYIDILPVFQLKITYVIKPQIFNMNPYIKTKIINRDFNIFMKEYTVVSS